MPVDGMIIDACLTYDAIQESQITTDCCNRQRLTIPCGLTRFLSSWEGVEEDDMTSMAREFGVEVMAKLDHTNERKGWRLGIYYARLLIFLSDLGTLLVFRVGCQAGPAPVHRSALQLSRLGLSPATVTPMHT